MTILLAASAGGHVAQLHALRPLLPLGGDPVVWATFRTPQTESLLAGEDVVWFDYIPPRGMRQVARGFPSARRVIRDRGVKRVFSTGSGIALAVFPVARMAGAECTYIESAARSTGPSLTGRIVSRIPGVEAQCQYRTWAGGRWSYRSSVFDLYSQGSKAESQVRRVLVTLGTIRPFGFERLLEQLVRIVPDDVEVLCQHGDTRIPVGGVDRANWTWLETMPARSLADEAAKADAVIAHAGIGSALMALDAGRRPVLVPRRAVHQEHVDDHQEQIAQELELRSLAVVAEAGSLTWGDVLESARIRVTHGPADV